MNDTPICKVCDHSHIYHFFKPGGVVCRMCPGGVCSPQGRRR